MKRVDPLIPAPEPAMLEDALGSRVVSPPQPAYDFLTPPDRDGDLGQFAGRYRVRALLGEGGMGVVLLAQDRQLDRAVALKVMQRHLAGNPEYRARFLREAQGMARHAHPRIIPIYDHGEFEGHLYLTMPYLAGESLQARLKREPRLPLRLALRVVREAAEGLQVAHQARQVHRDVKPSNLWLKAPETDDGLIVVLDFGLVQPLDGESARLTQPGYAIGTRDYMSPEHYDGGAIDARSDLYSLGVVLLEMLTGERADRRKHQADRLPAGTPTPVKELVAGLLQPRAADRLADAAELIRQVRSIEGGQDTVPECRPFSGDSATTPTTPKPPSPADPHHRPDAAPPTRRWVVLALGGMAGVAVGVPFLWPGLVVRGPQPAGVSGPWGLVDLLLVERDGGPVRTRLADYGTVPVRGGDRFRIEARTDEPAYLYLFWVKSEGGVVPLYPWTPEKWGTRPDRSAPITELELPATKTRGFRVAEGGEGMETLVLLARRTPLAEPDEVVRSWFDDLPAQQRLADPSATVWFENGKIVEEGPRRRRGFEEVAVNNPVLQLQALLRERLAGPDTFTAAVSFARVR